MANTDNIIEPDRYGIWISTSFTIVLLALVLAIVVYSRTGDLMYMTQIKTLLINEKIEVSKAVAPTQAIEAAQATEVAQK